jgi:uncharacterized protein
MPKALLDPASILALYTAFNAGLMLVLAYRVMMLRRRTGTALGDGGHEPLQLAQRAHGNASEYVPITLLVLGALVVIEAPIWVLHGLGLSLSVARVLHAWGLSRSGGASFGRFTGTLLQWLALVFGIGALFSWVFA